MVVKMIQHTVLRADAFSSPTCVAKVERQVGTLRGVAGVKAYYPSSRIEVDHYPDLASIPEIVTEVGRVGHAATLTNY